MDGMIDGWVEKWVDGDEWMSVGVSICMDGMLHSLGCQGHIKILHCRMFSHFTWLTACLR